MRPAHCRKAHAAMGVGGAAQERTSNKPFIVVIDRCQCAMSPNNAGSVEHALPPKSQRPLRPSRQLNSSSIIPFCMTTGDHPLLTPAMIDFMLQQAENTSTADVQVGLATAETIHAEYPANQTNIFQSRWHACLRLQSVCSQIHSGPETAGALAGPGTKPKKAMEAGCRPLACAARLVRVGMLTPERAFG